MRPNELEDILQRRSMSGFNFEIPSRQSLKGIIFLLFPSFAKFLKSAYIPLIYYVIQFFRKPERYQELLPYIIICIVGLLIFYLIRSILLFRNFKFSISKGHFVLTQGITKKKRIEIPLHKIQNVHIKQNVVQQVFNVVEIYIDTAGDTTTEVGVKTLEKEKALALKNALLDKVDETIEESTKDAILRISFMELFLVGVTQNHLNSFYILSALTFGLLVDLRDFLKMIGYEDLVDELKEKASESISYTVGIYFVAILLAIFFSFAYSVIKTWIANYRLEVVKKDDKIEIRKGLFNRLSYSLNPSKVQSMVYGTNILKQKFGLYNLRFNQAMSSKTTKKNIAIVGINKSHLEILEQFVFQYKIDGTLRKRKPASYFKTQLFLNSVVLLGVINGLTLSLLGPQMGYLNLLLIPWLFWMHALRYQKCYYTLGNDYMTVGEGRIDTLTNVFEYHKIQSVKLKRTFFQKRRNVASLMIHTASNLIKIPSIPYSDAIELYDYLVYKVESSPKNWI